MKKATSGSAIVEKGGGSYLANKKRVDDILYELQLENEQLQAGKACLPKKTDEIDMYKRKMIEKWVALNPPSSLLQVFTQKEDMASHSLIP